MMTSKQAELAARRMLRLPPCNWEKAVDKLDQPDRQEVARCLLAIAIRSCEVAAYVDQRCGGTHRAAVRNTNRVANLVRIKGFGFNGPTQMGF